MEKELIANAIGAAKKSEVAAVDTGAPAVVSSGPPAKGASAGPAPKPQDKVFSAIITDPSQVNGALDNLQK